MSGRPLEHGLQLRDFAAAIIAVAAVLSPEEQIRVTINSVPHRPFTRCTAVQCSRSPTRLNADRCGAACVQPCSEADAVERFVSERMRSCGRLRNDHFRQSAVHSSMLPHLGRIRHTTKAVFDERKPLRLSPCRAATRRAAKHCLRLRYLSVLRRSARCAFEINAVAPTVLASPLRSLVPTRLSVSSECAAYLSLAASAAHPRRRLRRVRSDRRRSRRLVAAVSGLRQ